MTKKELRCTDVGFNCEGVIQAESVDEVLAQAAVHVRQMHGLDEIDDETEQAIRAVIHDAA